MKILNIANSDFCLSLYDTVSSELSFPLTVQYTLTERSQSAELATNLGVNIILVKSFGRAIIIHKWMCLFIKMYLELEIRGYSPSGHVLERKKKCTWISMYCICINIFIFSCIFSSPI